MPSASEHGLTVVDSSNIDEWLYRITGSTHRGPFWRTWIRTKWWVRGLKEKLKPHGEIKFLLLDLQQMYVGHRKRRPMRLRFIDKDGSLKSGWFVVSNKYGYFHIKEAWFKSIRPAKLTKGPMTFKKANRLYRHITLKGFVNTWLIPYEKTI